MFCVLMELLKEKDRNARTLVSIHKNAAKLDQRYQVPEKEKEKIIHKCFPSGMNNPLKIFPSKEKINWSSYGRLPRNWNKIGFMMRKN